MFLKLFFTVLILTGFYFIHDWQNEGFRLNKIRTTLDFNKAWETDNTLSSEELKNIFNQPFYYLGKGAQTYAFASQDGRYVLKFFRFFNKYATPLENLPIESVKRTAAKRKRKQQKDFSSYKLAFEKLKDETGLLYLHLNQSNHLKIEVALYDKMRQLYKLPLDEMGFILQKKASPFYPTLTRWIEENDTEAAKEGLHRLIELLSKRCSAGLSDKDPDLATNFGFIGHQPIQFDIGRFKVTGEQKKEQELQRICAKLQLWLEQKAPDLALYLKNEISH